MKDLSCAYSKTHKVRELSISFVEDGKLWTITVPLCVDPDCLVARGGTSVDHRSEQGVRQS